MKQLVVRLEMLWFRDNEEKTGDRAGGCRDEGVELLFWSNENGHDRG